jgi:endonuclease YncB( thermonuclease family)
MKLLLATLILLTSLTAQADYTDWKYTRVVDGDTVEFEAKWLLPELGSKIKIRVYGVDTPEKPPRAQCDKEAQKALAASAFTKTFMINAKSVTVQVKSWDKYGGRLLGNVIVDGKDLRNELIKNNLAREYYGDAKQSWCN